MKRPRLKNEDIAKLLQTHCWPHLEKDQKWKQTTDSFPRVCRMVKRLCDLGMPVEDAISMFRELYWCAYDDIKNMPEPKPVDEPRKLEKPYFDEHSIMFRLNGAELTQDELQRDYAFYSNLCLRDERVVWINTGNGPLHHLLTEILYDDNFAFGPTKKQKGWPPEKLAEVDAVGLYKRKEVPLKPTKHGVSTSRSIKRATLLRK